MQGCSKKEEPVVEVQAPVSTEPVELEQNKIYMTNRKGLPDFTSPDEDIEIEDFPDDLEEAHPEDIEILSPEVL